jgi:hypothetical protein
MTKGSQPFDRATLELAFERLGRMAVDAGRIVEISVYGGSALILTLPSRPTTQDVDAVFDKDREFIRRAASSIAEEFGWDTDWLNDGVKGFLSAGDADAKSLYRTYPSETAPGLRVFVAAPAYLFAMKSMAMRISGADRKRDTDDIRELGHKLSIRDASQAIAVVMQYYPADRIPPKTQLGLEEIFGPVT